MTVESKGRGLFIVDNSVSGWTGLRYLEEWSSIAKAFDIATGYFEISALLTLDGKWQGLDKIRILMGAETTHRTRKAILEAVRAQALNRLDESIEEDKEPNPFLHGVPAILEALRSGQIECRVYAKDKFHAKAYITHARLEVVGAQALVGSSNFTRPGLTKNIELNVQVQSAREVAQLQEWFETHWNEAKEVTEDVIETISRHTHLYSPFDVYAKALQQFFRGHDLSATEWDETRSRMFPHLDRYQKEAYWALLKIARQHSGAFLCDGVGLGKTFVGLMLIERLVLHEGKRVALFAPKATKEGVWEPHLRRWLPHIGGVGGGADFSNLAVFSHTDLGRKGAFPDRFRRIAELADVVVIDEAHHFRNPGRQSRPDTGIEPSRYYRLFELLDNAERPKTVFMLTATPINNRLSDFRHMTELFTRRDEAYFARTIGVNNLRAHFNQMENTLLLSFDDALSVAIGTEIAPGILLADSCRYVDDLRILVAVAPKSDGSSDDLKKTVSRWLSEVLEENATDLALAPTKSQVVALGGDERPQVRQSAKMNRIQSAVSGGFDALGGEEILDAIQGLMRAQEALSVGDDSGWRFSPVPDVRDETVARFGAARYRTTFRSIRPLLHDDDTEDESEVGRRDTSPGGRLRVARTRRELDEDARAFALELVQRWIDDPSNVRLLRIGLDLWPDVELLREVLSLLRPFTETGGRRKAPRRVAWYCLAEVLRAGATETGLVADTESLPPEINLESYRAELGREAARLASGFARTDDSLVPPTAGAVVPRRLRSRRGALHAYRNGTGDPALPGADPIPAR